MIRSKRLQNRITAGRFTLPAAVFLSLFCWVLTSILLPEIPVMKSNYPLWETIYNDWIPTWASAPLSFLLYGIIGYSRTDTIPSYLTCSKLLENEEEDYNNDGKKDGNDPGFAKTKDINLACMLQGSFPQKADEIAIDSRGAYSSGYCNG